MKALVYVGVLVAAAVSWSGASAQPDAARPVVIIGHVLGPAVRTFGPDLMGRYTLRIETADLNLSTPEGQRELSQRVELGAAQLCEVNSAGGDVPGFYNASRRACMSDAKADAQAQSARAPSSSVASLDITRGIEPR